MKVESKEEEKTGPRGNSETKENTVSKNFYMHKRIFFSFSFYYFVSLVNSAFSRKSLARASRVVCVRKCGTHEGRKEGKRKRGERSWHTS